MEISKKVVLMGFFGVGKTSLIKRFVHQKFDESYLTTIGVKIDKKVIDVGGIRLNMLIWDIAGETSQLKVPQSYKLGANGICYVFDCSRPSSYENLSSEIKELQQALPNASIIILGNKIDLLNEDIQKEIKQKIHLDNVWFTSAKTGEMVDDAFKKLAEEILK